MGVASPAGLVAASFVAGKALGAMLMEDRSRGFEITREDTVTTRGGRVSMIARVV